MKPVYQVNGIALFHGRCEDVLPRITGHVDAFIADLPYASTRNNWDQPIDLEFLWDQYHRLSSFTSPVILFGAGRFSAQMITSNPNEYRYSLVWDKAAVSGHLNAKKQPLRAHEDILVFYRRPPSYDPQMIYTGRSSSSRGSKLERTTNHYGHHVNTPTVEQHGYQYPRSIVTFPRPTRGRHPTQKPVALFEWLIRSYTRPGDLVLDNVSGVGTTLVAARNCGRRAIGIEVHGPYVDTTLERLRSGAEGDTW